MQPLPGIQMVRRPHQPQPVLVGAHPGVVAGGDNHGRAEERGAAVINLRPYQQQLIADLRGALRRHRRVICQLPTGGGKTALAVHMMGTAAARGRVCWFVVHRQELIDQTSAALWDQGLEHGLIVAGGHRHLARLPIQVASVQTLVRRLDRLVPPDFIVVDEAHRSVSASYSRILAAYPAAHVVGLTATPQRTDGQPLGALYGEIVRGPPPRWLMDEGFLSDYAIYAPQCAADLSGLHLRGGDYARDEAEAAMDRPTITGDAVAHYQRLAAGRRAIVFCVSRAHAAHVCAAFSAAGVSAECITGASSDADRRGGLERFRSGQTLILCSVDLVIEGVNVPAAECAIILRPTQSLIVWLQACGRVLRPSPSGAPAIILDHVGNTLRHGLPDDEREWTLDGRPKRHTDDEPQLAVRQCPACFAVHRPAPACPRCGHVYLVVGREVEEVAGELVALDVEAIRQQRRAAQAKARSLEDLVRVGIERGMRSPEGWAAHVAAARRMGDINELRARARDIRRAIGE